MLNANYLLSRGEAHLPGAAGRPLHARVRGQRPRSSRAERGISAMDIAKRLLDYGFHAPTVYFPLIVREAMMIEPTETESKETLDAFAADAVPHHAKSRPTCCTTRRTPRRSAGPTKCAPPGSRSWPGPPRKS